MFASWLLGVDWESWLVDGNQPCTCACGGECNLKVATGKEKWHCAGEWQLICLSSNTH